MSTTQTSVLPAKRGRGRKPVSERNAARDRISAWKLTPEEKRQPPTLTALAAELQMSKQLVSYYAQQAPESIEELVDNTERETLVHRYPGVLKTLGELAEKGNVEAIKVFIHQLAEPRRPEQKKPSPMANIHLQQTIQMLLHPTDVSTMRTQPVVRQPQETILEGSK